MTSGIHPSFERLEAPGTGRPMIQLTSGPGFCYPLYYYVPSFAGDGRYLIHHRADAGEVQLHRVDLATGESLQLTHGSAPETWWRPWCSDAGTGVLDHRSAL
ncbi:MAG: oligogalacturonate lyase family protein, partial [Chloroflexi bacterium]|nr:oligogalacturonate lyase family protein [Chloroflexota bacterium]